MKITNLTKVQKTRMEMEGAKNTWKQVPLSRNEGSPNFSFRVFTIEPDGHTPYHSHPFEHLNYVIEGRGALVMEAGETRPVVKGDFVLVLPEEKHQYRNADSSKPLVIICAVPKDYE